MAKTWVKICGITSLHDALLAQSAGADAVGLVLSEEDPRGIRLDEAAEIAAQLTIEAIPVVGRLDPEGLREILFTLQPRNIQCRGPRPSPAPAVGWYQEYPLVGRGTLSQLRERSGDRFLVRAGRDYLPGGRHFKRDRHLLRELGSLGGLVLSGDLDPWNVLEICRSARPMGVDACATLEKDFGVKDWEITSAFVRNVRQAG